MSASLTYPAAADVRPARPFFPRAVPVALTLLAGLLLALGILSSWFLKRIDAQYRQLLTQTAADLNHVQDIALHSGVAYANVLDLRLATDAAKRAELLQSIGRERAANDRVYDDLGRTLTDPGLRACLNDVLAKRQVFRGQTDALIASQTAAGRLTEADAAQTTDLLRSFVAYQRSCDKLTDQIQAASLERCNQTTHEVNKLRLLFFGLGVLPIAAAFLLFVLLISLIRATPVESDLR